MAMSTELAAPFGDLPAEILIHIFERVDYSVLISMSKDAVLKDFTFIPKILRWLDLCRCKADDEIDTIKLLSLVTRTRHIEQLCVNHFSYGYNGHANPRLERIFLSETAWTSLKTLHVSHCKLEKIELMDILQYLPCLKELSWSLFTNTIKSVRRFGIKRRKLQKPRITTFGITKLNLDLLCSHTQLLKMLEFLKSVPALETFRVQLYHYTDPYRMEMGAADNLESNLTNLTLPKLQSFSLNTDNHDIRTNRGRLRTTGISRPRCISSVINSIVLDKSGGRDTKWRKFESCNNYLCKLEELDINLTRSSNTIYVHNRTLDPALIDWIVTTGNEELQYLSLVTCHFHNCEETLSELFNKCPNISELNLDRTKVECYGSYMCISYLEQLRKLLIPDEVVYRTKIWLSPLVTSCPQLTELDIRGFGTNSSSNTHLSDDDYEAISELKHLKSLTMIKTEGVQRGKFLIKIAEKCGQLESLRLHNLGTMRGLCTYWHYLGQALRLMSALKVLSLHHHHFEIDKPFLWACLSHIKLRQFCLGTDFNGSINVESVLGWLNVTGCVDVFHIHARIQNHTDLSKKVKAAIAGNIKMEDFLVQRFTADENSIEEPNSWLEFDGCFVKHAYLCAGLSEIARDVNHCGFH